VGQSPAIAKMFGTTSSLHIIIGQACEYDVYGEIQLVINTPSGKLSQYDDSYIRKAAIKYKVPYITTLAAAMATARGIAAHRQGKSKVKSLQSYHTDIK